MSRKRRRWMGGPTYEVVETLVVLGPREREEMLRWYEGVMPIEISKGRRDVGLPQLKWMVQWKIEENQGMLKEEAMRDGMKKGVFRKGNSPNERLDFGKTFREVYLGDLEYCGWTVRQEKLTAQKLRQLNYFLQRMEDLTTKNLGICGKADEVERQLRDRVLEVSCEEQPGKLARQETRALGERQMQEEECRVKMEHEGEVRQRGDWADMGVDDSLDGTMTCVDLGGRVGIENPQEEQREEQRRQGKQEEQLAEAQTRGGKWSWQGEEKTENGEAGQVEKKARNRRRRRIKARMGKREANERQVGGSREGEERRTGGI